MTDISEIITTIEEAILVIEDRDEQYEEVEDSFYPLCRSCGRSNIEHHMSKEFTDCKYVNRDAIIEKLKISCMLLKEIYLLKV